MAYIEINNVTKTIKNANVLDNVSISLDKGGIYGFVGKNGSGKTMLFKALLGLIRLSSGEILVDGIRIESGVRFPFNVGVMIENTGLWPYLSATDNLKTLASIKGLVGKAEIKETVSRVGLDPESKKTYAKFSLGMKQRLVFAQAILEKPELMVLDEPTNAMDADGVILFKDIIRQERERGATVLIASHSLEDFENFCDEVFRMENGRLVSDYIASEELN